VRTDELIARLARDAAPQRRPMARRLGACATAGFLAAAAIALGMWGARPDLMTAAGSMMFWVKAGYALILALAAMLALERLGRPGGGGRAGWALALAAAAAMIAIAAHQLMIDPVALWRRDLMGHSWTVCSLRIALVAAPAFAAALVALRGMAPTRPRLAGAAGGLLAGGLGAAAYALTCNEMAAAFLAVWYTLGMLTWAGVGALTGPWVLRW
jgi:hypothetical protein